MEKKYYYVTRTTTGAFTTWNADSFEKLPGFKKDGYIALETPLDILYVYKRESETEAFKKWLKRLIDHQNKILAERGE